MLVRVGCTFDYEVTWPTPAIMLVAVRLEDLLSAPSEERLVRPAVPVHEYLDSFGNRCWRVVAPQGEFRLGYDAVVEVTGEPDPMVPLAPQTPVEALPDQVIAFTLPSRHCQSDLLSNAAWDLFGSVPPGWGRIQAVCDWIHRHIEYRKGSIYTTSSVEVYEARAGVCRDFAHLGVTFCRALNVPARYVFGFLPDAGIVPPDEPMDFHAWFEAYVDGRWRTFDARHNMPRIGRVPVGRGRDAVDVAMATTFGAVRLAQMEVWADEVDAGGTAISGLNVGKLLGPKWAAEVLA